MSNIYRFISPSSKQPIWYTSLAETGRHHTRDGYIVYAEAEEDELEPIGDRQFRLKQGVRVPVTDIRSSQSATVSGPKGMLHIQTLKSVLSGGMKYKRLPSKQGEIVMMETHLGGEIPLAILLNSLSSAGKKIEVTREPLADVPLLFDGKEWTMWGEELLRQAFENVGFSEPEID